MFWMSGVAIQPELANVVTSIPFLIIGVRGIRYLAPHEPTSRQPSAPFAVFVVSLILVGVGSIFYHCSPSPERLLWDRLPIAVCLASLGCMLANLYWGPRVSGGFLLLSVAGAVATVLYWYVTWRGGHADLRPYAALQVLTAVSAALVAVGWRLSRFPLAGFRLALMAYVGGRLCELFEGQIYRQFGTDFGHPMKHLLLAITALLIVRSLRPSSAAQEPLVAQMNTVFSD